jgi:uncharacterized GH25 family protein
MQPCLSLQARRAVSSLMQQAPSALARLCLCLGLAGPAAAHDFWIEPSSHTLAPGQALATRLFVGEHFRGEAVQRPAPQSLRRFVMADTTGRLAATLPGRAGAEPAGQARLAQPGRYIVAYEGKPIAIELPAAIFNPYLQEEGLDAVMRARAAAGQAEAPGREIYARCAKSLLQVGSGAEVDAQPVDRVLGLTLELLAESRPQVTAQGATLPVRLLLDGRPLQGALVMALSQGAPDRRIQQRSNADGRVHLVLDRTGPWLIKAVHMRAAPADSGADWQSLWASLTLAVDDAGP